VRKKKEPRHFIVLALSFYLILSSGGFLILTGVYFDRDQFVMRAEGEKMINIFHFFVISLMAK